MKKNFFITMMNENQILRSSFEIVSNAEKSFRTGQLMPLEDREIFLRVTKCVKLRRPLRPSANRLQKFLYEIFDAVVEVCSVQLQNLKKCSVAGHIFRFCNNEPNYDRSVVENFFHTVYYFFKEITRKPKIQKNNPGFSLN